MYQKKRFSILVALLFLLCSFNVFAGGLVCNNKIQHAYDPLFVGFIVGYGETDYASLKAWDQDTQMATLIGASDRGMLGGLLIGYQLTPFFVGELSWVRYPEAQIDMYWMNNYNKKVYPSYKTDTNAFSLILQFLVSVYHTKLKAYADAGVALVTRKDILANIAHVSPTFGVGLMYNFTQHLLAQFGFVYVAGYDQARTDPLVKYVPFLLSAQFKLAYRIPV